MKKRIAGLVAVAALGLIAWPKVAPLLEDEERVDSPARSGAPAVRTQRLRPQPFASTLTFNGTLVADKSIEIKSELRGKIDRIAFTSGQQVSTGDLVVTIESGELAAELASVREQLELAETNAERLQSLFERGSVTASERDDAVSRREVLRADQRRLEVRLQKTRILAPFAGTLGLRRVSPGDLIEAETLITTLQTVADLKVDFSVPERYRALVQPKVPLTLFVAGYDEPFQATVQAVDPRVDIATRTLTVRAEVDNSSRKLLPGNYARVELINRSDDALLVPSLAVLQSVDAVSVFTVKDGVAVRREVETGERSASRVRILDGLEPGDEVITSGIQSVRDGQPVNVRNRPDVG